MNCQEVQSLITQYVNGQLEGKKLEDFLLHITNCSSCQEELEVYYIVINGIKRMDQDDDIAIDYHEAFLDSLKESEEKIRWKKMHHSSQRIVLLLVVVFISYSLSLSVGKYDIDHTISYRIEGESEYDMEPYFFKDKYTNLEAYAFAHFEAYRDSFMQKVQTGERMEVNKFVTPTMEPTLSPTSKPTTTPKSEKKKKKSSSSKIIENTNKNQKLK